MSRQWQARCNIDQLPESFGLAGKPSRGGEPHKARPSTSPLKAPPNVSTINFSLTRQLRWRCV
jgi:hypothetical protein